MVYLINKNNYFIIIILNYSCDVNMSSMFKNLKPEIMTTVVSCHIGADGFSPDFSYISLIIMTGIKSSIFIWVVKRKRLTNIL